VDCLKVPSGKVVDCVKVPSGKVVDCVNVPSGKVVDCVKVPSWKVVDCFKVPSPKIDYFKAPFQKIVVDYFKVPSQSFYGIFKILSLNVFDGTEGNNQNSTRFFWTSFEAGVTPIPKWLVTLGAQRMLFLEEGSAFCNPYLSGQVCA
jgi:hypothetical protein